MIFVCFLVFTASGAAANVTTGINQTKIDGVGNEIFNRYNENAETFQTGVLVRLDDDEFLFGNTSDPIGLSCTEGYMRPVVLNVIRSTLEQNIYRTQVVIKNLTIFYKDCRVSEESEMFRSATLKTPCFLTIDISALICWALVRSKNLTKKTCQNSIDMDLGDDITGAGSVRLFFLPSSTLYTFSLVLDYRWTKKIQEAVSRTSLILLSDYYDCMDLPTKSQGAPTFGMATHLGKEPGQGKEEDTFDDTDFPDNDESEEEYDDEDYDDDDYDQKFLTTVSREHNKTKSTRKTTSTAEPSTQLTTTTTEDLTEISEGSTTTTNQSRTKLVQYEEGESSTTDKDLDHIEQAVTLMKHILPRAKTSTTSVVPDVTSTWKTTTTTEPSTQLTTTTTEDVIKISEGNTTTTNQSRTELELEEETTYESRTELTQDEVRSTTTTNQSRTELAPEEGTTNQSTTELTQDEKEKSSTTDLDHIEPAVPEKEILQRSPHPNPNSTTSVILNVTSTERDENESFGVTEGPRRRSRKRKKNKIQKRTKKTKTPNKKTTTRTKKEKKKENSTTRTGSH